MPNSRCWIFCFTLSLLPWGCVTRSFDASAPVAGTEAEFSSDISKKRQCSSPAFSYVSSGEKPTTVYHWTNDKMAATNPKKYLEKRVRAAIQQNDAGDFGKSMLGNGLYVAMDPFQSSSYGLYLVQFEILPHSKFPKETQRDTETALAFYRAKCAGVHYDYDLPFSFLKTQKYRIGPALVLWDLAAVDPKSIRAFQPGTPSGNPAFDAVLNDALIKFGWQTTVPQFLTQEKAKEALLAQTLATCYAKKLDFTKKNAATEFEALGRLALRSRTYFSTSHACYEPDDGSLWEACAGSLGLRTHLANCKEQYAEAQKWQPADYQTKLKQAKDFWQGQVEFWSKQYSLENWTRQQ